MSTTIEAAGDAAHSSAQQFVTFAVHKELFGIPLAEVQEIIRMPELVQVPLSPPSLEGIANLRGTVLPVTNLRRVFGIDDTGHDDATRVVVVQRDATAVGFVVDRMASVITADPSEIEQAGSVEATVRSPLVRGVVKRAGAMILLLDPERLLAAEGRGGTKATAQNLRRSDRDDEEGAAGVALDEVQLVSFEVAGQEYAFPVEAVQEIVQVPTHIAVVPKAGPHVLGVMTLRDRLLPLVSLRRMFGLREIALDDNCRIVVVTPFGDASRSVGLVLDRVREVLRVARQGLEQVPPLLAPRDASGVGEFEAICRLEGGKRLVTILSAERMFADAAFRGALAAASVEGAATLALEDRMDGISGTGAATIEEEEQFVVFRLAGEDYGVPIASVQEIVRVPEDLTHVPKTAGFMEGVVNLRGTVLPVVDQRLRFDLAAAERNDRQRIMVLLIDGLRTGFIVDSVSEVLRIPRGVIDPAPILSEEQARLIRRVANLETQKRMVLLLEPDDLLDAGERRELEHSF